MSVRVNWRANCGAVGLVTKWLWVLLAFPFVFALCYGEPPVPFLATIPITVIVGPSPERLVPDATSASGRDSYSWRSPGGSLPSSASGERASRASPLENPPRGSEQQQPGPEYRCRRFREDEQHDPDEDQRRGRDLVGDIRPLERHRRRLRPVSARFFFRSVLRRASRARLKPDDEWAVWKRRSNGYCSRAARRV